MPARRVVQAGRGAFFPTPDADLPVRQSSILRQDDQIPQLGFVGANYAAHRVLLLGINPGNGGNNQKRIPADDKMMPAMYAFAREPTEQNFVALRGRRGRSPGRQPWQSAPGLS